MISWARINSNISRDKSILVINKEQNYFSLKESIGGKYNLPGDIERDRLIEQCQRIRMDGR